MGPRPGRVCWATVVIRCDGCVECAAAGGRRERDWGACDDAEAFLSGPVMQIFCRNRDCRW